MATPWLIKLLFYALIVIVVWNFFTLPLAQQGIAGIYLLTGFAIFAYIVDMPLKRRGCGAFEFSLHRYLVVT